MHKILFDDGAGDVKAGIARDGVMVNTLRFPSLVYEMSKNFEVWNTHKRTMKVTNGEGIAYLVGDVVRDTIKIASYDTSHTRYTSTDALMRFYASCGKLMPPGHHDIQLVVGANVSAYQKQNMAIQAFYQRQHKFRYNDQDFHIRVDQCRVVSQPRGAWAAIEAYPPKAIAGRVADRPLDQSVAILIDIGNLTTDVVVMDRGNEVNRFALTLGVQELRDNVAHTAMQIADETELPLSAVDRAMRDKIVVDAHGDDRDISEYVARDAKTIWGRAYKTIRSRLDGVKPHYIIVVGGGAEVYRQSIEQSWGALNGFCIPDEPSFTVLNGYALL